MSSPNHLRHKPIIEIPDYESVDLKFYPQRVYTDAQAISIGFSQFNNAEITAKMWRKPNNRWSRQSEELPLHRVLDMAIFIIENLKTNTILPLGTSISLDSKVAEIENHYRSKASEYDKRINEIMSAIALHNSKP